MEIRQAEVPGDPEQDASTAAIVVHAGRLIDRLAAKSRSASI